MPERRPINLRKHGVSFDEARTVCEDPFRLEREDWSHSHGSVGLVTTGWSALGRLLTVVTSERDGKSSRIISAWRATKRERDAYERRR